MKHSLSLSCVLLVLLICGSYGKALEERRTKLQSYESSLHDLATRGKVSHERQTRFRGGQTADWAQFPYTVAILKGEQLLSGGAIIAEDLVLTSQAFIYWEEPSALTVLANNNVEKKVSAIYKMPENIFAYLAVLKLESKFDLSGSNIKSIELGSVTVPVGTNCTVVGVGGEFFQNWPTANEKLLHYMNLPTVDLSVCEDYWAAQDLTDAHVCAGHHKGEPNVDCEPTLGDPLVCDGILTGIGSTLNLCGNEIASGIYGNVAYHREWIEQQMSGSLSTSTTTKYTGSTTSTSTTKTSETTTEALDTTTPNTAALRTSSYSTVAALLIAAISISCKRTIV